MTTRIVINGKEVDNPIVKAALGMLAVIFFGVFAAVVVFLILPLLGIAVNLIYLLLRLRAVLVKQRQRN